MEIAGMAQSRAGVQERFPIWFSSIDYEMLTDVSNTPTAEDYARAHTIVIREVNNEGQGELDSFLTRCCIDCSHFGGNVEEKIFQVGQILADKDLEYKVWGVELKSLNEMVVRLVERKAPWKRKDEYISVSWCQDYFFQLEILMRPGTNIMDIERTLCLIRCPDDSPLQKKIMLVEYMKNKGCRVDTYYPEMEPPKWIDLIALARRGAPMDYSWSWKS